MPSCSPFNQRVKHQLSAMFSCLKRAVICGSEKYLESDEPSGTRRPDSPSLRNSQTRYSDEAIKRDSLNIENTPPESETAIITVPISDKPVVTIETIEKSSNNEIKINELTSSQPSQNNFPKQILTTSSSTDQDAHSTKAKEKQVRQLLDEAEKAGQEGAALLFRQAIDLLKGIENPDRKLLCETVDRLSNFFGEQWRSELAPLFLDALEMTDQSARKYDLLRDNPEYLTWGRGKSNRSKLDIQRESKESCRKARDTYEFGAMVLREYGKEWVSNTSDPLDVTTAKLLKLTIDMADRTAILYRTYGDSAGAEAIQRFNCEIMQDGLRSRHPEIREEAYRYLPFLTARLQTTLTITGRKDEADAIGKYETIMIRIFYPNSSMYAETSMEQKRVDYEVAVEKMRNFGYKVLDFAQLNVE